MTVSPSRMHTCHACDMVLCMLEPVCTDTTRSAAHVMNRLLQVTRHIKILMLPTFAVVMISTKSDRVSSVSWSPDVIFRERHMTSTPHRRLCWAIQQIICKKTVNTTVVLLFDYYFPSLLLSACSSSSSQGDLTLNTVLDLLHQQAVWHCVQ